MKQKTATGNLNDAILLLQNKQSDELLLLQEQFHITYQSIKPINLIKSTIQEITQTPDIKNNIAQNLIGLTTGYLTKKVLVGKTSNPIKILFGNILQIAVTNIVSKNSEGIIIAGESLLHSIIKYRHGTKQHHYQNGNS